MNINYFKEKIKGLVDNLREFNLKDFIESDNGKKLATSLIILLVAFSSFGLGRLSKITENSDNFSVLYPPNYNDMMTANVSKSFNLGAKKGSEQSPIPGLENAGKTILASKNGSKYYFTTCSGANRIKETNRIWFNSEDEAKSRGLTKSATCK